ncbi:MAG TPA: Asp-tRNA(Asn)/Glu-tRNA(Gln) amidotransferase subunit GatC [Candidatus Obscuribacterales bacterium]
MITVKDVEHVARLARLELTEEEKQLFTEQLAKIIEAFDELKNIDTDGVEPMSHALAISNVMREDVVAKPPGHEVLLANAPDKEKGFFKVPRITE